MRKFLRDKIIDWLFPEKETMPISMASDISLKDKIVGASSFNQGEYALRRDTTMISRHKMIQFAHNLYVTSGLVKRFIDDSVNFIVSDGITLSVENDTEKEDALQILNEFWNDSYNNMDIRLPDRIASLCLLGELCLPVSVNKHTGKVVLSFIDTQNIHEVETIRDFPEIAAAVKLSGIAGRSGKILSVIREETNGMNKNYGLLVGECFYFAINKMPNVARGYSDLVQLFDFVEAYEDGLFSELDRIKLIRNFVWDVTLDGADEQTIKEFLKNNPSPKPGSVRAHNESVNWQALAPSLQASDNRTFFDMMRTYMSAVVNRPDSWLGTGGKTYSNEAELMGEPTFKALARRQKFIKYMLESILQFVIDQAVIHGKLNRQEKHYKPIVIMPEMSIKNMASSIANLNQGSQALLTATMQGWINKETASKFFAYLAEQTGYEMQKDEIRDVIPEINPDYNIEIPENEEDND